MKDDTFVNVVMVTHQNRIEYLEQTIPAILDSRGNFKLTLVCNKVNRKVRVWLEEFGDALTVIYNTKNVGWTLAANKGWSSQEADYHCFVGDDCLAKHRNWLIELVDIADCCPEVGIVGHSVEGVWRPRRVGTIGCQRVVQVQPSGLGGIILIPNRTEEICGRWDENLPIYGEEDALYGWKVRHAGLLCAYFDDREAGRRFVHLDGGSDDPEYRKWKDEMRYQQAIPIRDDLIEQYCSGKRPLSYYKKGVFHYDKTSTARI